jgi:probable F420-dependent oxidoreductase
LKYATGIFPTQYTVQPDELAQKAEERGFESLWFPEHTHIPSARKTPWPGGAELPREYSHSYDQFVACTAAAVASREIKVATGICLVVQRDPIVTAKAVASIDNLSGGRFIFGIGGGWNVEEVEHHGTRFETRFSLLRERVLAMRELWTKDEAEFHGRFVDFDASWSWPKPVQQPHPPIIMGGDGPTTFDRVIEFCDGWLPIARGRSLPPGLHEKTVELRQRAKAAGRDPDKLTVTLFACPPAREFVDEAAKAGVDRVIFMLPCREPGEVWPVLDDCAKLVR